MIESVITTSTTTDSGILRLTFEEDSVVLDYFAVSDRRGDIYCCGFGVEEALQSVENMGGESTDIVACFP